MAIINSTIRPPTKSGNTITIPMKTNDYRYHVVGTEEIWTEGKYYILENTTIEIRPIRPEDTFPVGSTTSWHFTYAPENRRIYIPALLFTDFNVFVNDVNVTNNFLVAGNMQVSTTILPKIEVRVKNEDYFIISEDNPGRVVIGSETYPLELNSERTAGVYQETEHSANNFTLTLPVAFKRPYTVTYLGEHATLTLRLGGNLSDIKETHQLRHGDTMTFDKIWNYADVKIKADEGYRFTEYGQLVHGRTVEDIIVPFSKDNTEGQINISPLEYDALITMGARIIPEKVPTDILGFNNIYIVDKVKLSEISLDIYRKRRSYYIMPDGGNVDIKIDPFIAVDPHSYIINTLQLPVVIDEEDIGPDQPIELGFTKLLPNAPTLKTDKLTIDLGTIKVPEKYNNIYDYSATDVFIHLPYTNPVVVDPNYVVGHELSIQYIIDVYTGETTINLRSSLVEDRVIHSTVTYIGNVIPFITIRDATTIGSPKDSRSVIHNNTPIPYAEVMRKKPYQMDSQFNTNMRTTVDNLQDVTGRVYVHNISLDIDTTQMEVSLIKSILASGITIK